MVSCRDYRWGLANGSIVLMADPNWNRGFYYDGVPPHAGMKLARRKILPPSLSAR